MSFKIGILRSLNHTEKKLTQYHPSSLSGGGRRLWLTVFLVKKDFKIEYGFEDSISNVDLSSAAKTPINVYLCDTLVLLNRSNNITKN